MNTIDLSGQRVNMLSIIEISGKTKDNKILWKCVCDCGNIRHYRTSYFKCKNPQSCGCLKTRHGQAQKTAMYSAWKNMKNRCLYETNIRYKSYGGRGIKVCDRWLNSFKNFYLDMGEKPSKLHSLDRIDVNGNYEPSNCRWATMEEQARNTSRNINFTIDNQTKCITEWAIILGIKPSKVLNRIRSGWELEPRAFINEAKKAPTKGQIEKWLTKLS